MFILRHMVGAFEIELGPSENTILNTRIILLINRTILSMLQANIKISRETYWTAVLFTMTRYLFRFQDIIPRFRIGVDGD